MPQHKKSSQAKIQILRAKLITGSNNRQLRINTIKLRGKETQKKAILKQNYLRAIIIDKKEEEKSQQQLSNLRVNIIIDRSSIKSKHYNQQALRISSSQGLATKRQTTQISESHISHNNTQIPSIIIIQKQAKEGKRSNCYGVFRKLSS